MIEKRKGQTMKIYTVYLDQVSYKPEHRAAKKKLGGGTAEWSKRVRSDSRTHALLKCLPEIRKEFPKLQGKYLSVFVGEKCNPSAAANRMTPIQIDISTGYIRGEEPPEGFDNPYYIDNNWAAK